MHNSFVDIYVCSILDICLPSSSYLSSLSLCPVNMSPSLPSPAVNNNSGVALFGQGASAGAAGGSPAVSSGGVGGSSAMGGNPNLMQSPSPATISALVSQHRLLELSRFNMRGYDLAQHMLTQQGAVSKLLGECKSPTFITYRPYRWRDVFSRWPRETILIFKRFPSP